MRPHVPLIVSLFLLAVVLAPVAHAEIYKCADEDGNVTMAEFLDGSSSDGRIGEFLDYDFNDDGVITPKEGKSAEAEKS